MGRDRYEYTTISLTGLSESGVEAAMNAFAAEGWRIVTAARWCEYTYTGQMTSALVLERRMEAPSGSEVSDDVE